MPHYIREKIRTLVVEDDRVAAQFIAEYLVKLGDVILVSDGEEALRVYEESLDDDPFYLICLDIGLPDMSGKDVLVGVREIEKKYQLDKDDSAKVIMTTAQGGVKEVLQCLGLGCNGYVLKPFTKEALFGELERAGIDVTWD